MGTDYAAVARLLANPARSAVVDALMDGRALASGELARLAGVQPSTMSEHLVELVDGGLLAMVAAGRHRYYRLAGAEVADALEGLSRICPAVPARSLRQSVADQSMRRARMCYDHIAGALGVALLERTLTASWLIADPVGTASDLDMTEAGADMFARIGVDPVLCRRTRRHFARSCMDWSERRMHLAGALGAATAKALLDQGWLHRVGTGRRLRITDQGEDCLRTVLGVELADTGKPLT